MEKYILDVINYFSFFDYPPTFEEIHTFLKKKVKESDLASILQKMEQKKLITDRIINFKFSIFNEFSIDKNQSDTPTQYTVRRYQRSNLKNQRYISKFKNRYFISQKKLRNLRFRLYIRLLSLFPQIILVGLSGTLSMMNAKKKDDIDLFIITGTNRLFTGRIITALLASIMGIKRKYSSHQSPVTNHQDKVCLNLFFDESNLKIFRHKQTEYVAHEVLQMKPLVNKNGAYDLFLAGNSWVFKIFPNARKIFNFQFSISNQSSIFNFQFLKFIGNIIENLLKRLQLTIIKLHQTSEIVTDTQLWFFPQDFENKILSRTKLVS